MNTDDTRALIVRATVAIAQTEALVHALDQHTEELRDLIIAEREEPDGD